MAIYSFNISHVSRANGSSSCATLSYITAEKVWDERRGELYNYGRGERVMAVCTMLPTGAPMEYQDPVVLFNAIEKYEKPNNARTAKKIMVALPREFDLERQIQVVEDFITKNITEQGYACTYAIHTDKENNNPHAHILIANRKITEKGAWSTKSRKEYALDERGNRIPLLDENGTQKLGKRNEKLWKRISVQVNPLDTKETLMHLREQWAEECNKYLAPDDRIDHRSYAAQGREEIPTIHEGYAARAIESRGGVSERCETNRQIRQKNSLVQSIQEKMKTMGVKLSAITQKWQKDIKRIIEIMKRGAVVGRPARGIVKEPKANIPFEFEIMATGEACITRYVGKETEVTIPDEIGGRKVTQIAPLAFLHCTNLTSVVLPATMGKIGYSAFEGCKNIENVNIPESVTEIGIGAFKGCISLKSISIPNHVKIGERAFDGCPIDDSAQEDEVTPQPEDEDKLDEEPMAEEPAQESADELDEELEDEDDYEFEF